MGQEDQDRLLQRFLNEEDPKAAQVCLEGLLSDYVEPVVRDIARYKSRTSYATGSGYEAQDEEDMCNEVVLQLISRLRSLRGSGAHSPIENFRGYVAATTYNVFHKYVRRKYPSRWRLKNRMRYLLNHSHGLTMWKDDEREFRCGLAKWRWPVAHKGTGSEDQPPPLEGFVQSLASGKIVSRMSLEELIKSFLAWRGRPVPLDELVGIVAELQGIQEPHRVQSQGEEREEGLGASICELLPDPAVDIASTVERRFYLELLWKEICQLPQRQRVALLLNLRDAQEGDALILFTLTGIVSLRRIAEAVELPLEELAALWNELPLQDMAIATLLGITRQQVINLRKSARERLERRMAAF